MRKYTILLEFDPETESYSVVVPALPGCTSAGLTVEECLANAKEAISGHIACLEAAGMPVPEEPDPSHGGCGHCCRLRRLDVASHAVASVGIMAVSVVIPRCEPQTSGEGSWHTLVLN